MAGLTNATFLDAATVNAELVRPACVDGRWEVHHLTQPCQAVERLPGMQIAFTNKVRIGPAELAAAPELRLVVVAATGYDIIDLDACRAQGVAVANSPGYSASSVPEHAVALMFAVARSLVPLGTKAVDGTWSAAPTFCLHDHPIMELAGKTAGIVGAGSLGRATGRLCAALGMEVVYRERHDGGRDDLPRLPLDELLATADVVSLHCPLDAANAKLMDATRLAAMKRGAILVNTSRGGLVDAAALVDALESGHLGGAGIDVLESEPPPADHPLLACRHPGLIVTPHVAWASKEVQQRLARLVADTADAFFAGNPVHIVS